ncbi:MAG: amino acid ABC transporter permease [Blastochloris sp.]|nr:amino acid ABC transporter permease [Blastochloris sp.]
MNRRFSFVALLFSIPWWLVILLGVGVYLVGLVASDPTYASIFAQLQSGISMTLLISFTSYALALVVGLMAGVVRAYRPKPPRTRQLTRVLASLLQLTLYNVVTLYVQVLRGIPIITTLLIVAFVIVPQINNFTSETLGLDARIRGTSPTAAIFALALVYGAFISETFRGGIQSIERGQIEAARSLGMSQGQIIRLIVLPQALRRILPPLGNDMVAMIKDSSLVAVLAINDISQVAKVTSSGNFLYFQTYMIAAGIYLALTTTGSMLTRWLERRLTVEAR